MGMEVRVYRPNKNGDLKLKTVITPDQMFKCMLSPQAAAELNYRIKGNKKTKKRTKPVQTEPRQFKYVHFNPTTIGKPWRAQGHRKEEIKKNGALRTVHKTINLGAFTTQYAAAQAVANHKGCKVEDLRK
ncbi:MAG: hypothetical protein G3M70_07145 [Candidatus Nitronauta litoralis]|uniref:Uncharacterized protein n=1 Tax=Candidatus Nitronauta litoralis TaxID=2705533 RepID=A0A7T0BWC4_9BACT|nr:MAG: hypothetical protein G3M70_07145 [Candidatus Nitronauta litoralis]